MGDDAVSKAVSHYTLEVVQPRVISFEDQGQNYNAVFKFSRITSFQLNYDEARGQNPV